MSLRHFRPFVSMLDSPSFTRNTPAFFGGNSLFQPPSSLFNELTEQASFPAVSVEEKDNGYEVTADIPSFRKEEIKVSLGDSNRRLIIAGESKTHSKIAPASVVEEGQQDDQKAGEFQDNGGEKVIAKTEPAGAVANVTPGYLINERSTYTSFRRAFHFNTPLDPNSLSAKLENGQLKVQVNKATEDEGLHSVEVQ